MNSTRGQGRSPYANFTEFHYDDFARDALALLDHLEIPKVAVVGWSDGGITGLNMAMNYSSRIERVFAHGANVQGNQSNPGLNDPIINSESGSLESSFSTNGTTYAVNGRLTKRADDSGTTYAVNGRLMKRAADSSNDYTCQSLSPLPERCGVMEQAVYR